MGNDMPLRFLFPAVRAIAAGWDQRHRDDMARLHVIGPAGIKRGDYFGGVVKNHG
jgi:hypothetical protein